MKFEMPSFQISVTHTCYKPYNIANIISYHFIHSQRCICGSCCFHLAACSQVQQFSEVSNSGTWEASVVFQELATLMCTVQI
jgi:hypothetical protein